MNRIYANKLMADFIRAQYPDAERITLARIFHPDVFEAEVPGPLHVDILFYLIEIGVVLVELHLVLLRGKRDGRFVCFKPQALLDRAGDLTGYEAQLEKLGWSRPFVLWYLRHRKKYLSWMRPPVGPGRRWF